MNNNKRQTDIVKRTAEICDEFDIRLEEVGISVARVELAKTLAECEAANSSEQGVEADAQERCASCGVIDPQRRFCPCCGSTERTT